MLKFKRLACGSDDVTQYNITHWTKRYFYIKIILVKKTSFNLLATLDSNRLLLPILISEFRWLQILRTYLDFLIKVKKEIG